MQLGGTLLLCSLYSLRAPSSAHQTPCVCVAVCNCRKITGVRFSSTSASVPESLVLIIRRLPVNKTQWIHPVNLIAKKIIATQSKWRWSNSDFGSDLKVGWARQLTADIITIRRIRRLFNRSSQSRPILPCRFWVTVRVQMPVAPTANSIRRPYRHWWIILLKRLRRFCTKTGPGRSCRSAIRKSPVWPAKTATNWPIRSWPYSKIKASVTVWRMSILRCPSLLYLVDHSRVWGGALEDFLCFHLLTEHRKTGERPLADCFSGVDALI